MNVAQAFSSRGAFLVRQAPKINGWPRSRAAGDGRKGSLQHPWACLGVGFYTKQGKGLLYKTLTGPVQEEASWKARAVPCVLSAGTDRCQPAVASPSVVALGSGGPRLGWYRSARSRSSPQRASSAHPPSLGSGALVQFSPSRSCPGLCHSAGCLPDLVASSTSWTWSRTQPRSGRTHQDRTRLRGRWRCRSPPFLPQVAQGDSWLMARDKSCPCRGERVTAPRRAGRSWAPSAF